MEKKSCREQLKEQGIMPANDRTGGGGKGSECLQNSLGLLLKKKGEFKHLAYIFVYVCV